MTLFISQNIFECIIVTMEKLKYNYHTHTYRCGHAVGTDEEYIKAAIDNGIKILGMSDHIPFPKMRQPGIRQNCTTMKSYISSFKKLKEKYEDQIEIHLGFEVEYLPEFEWWYKELLAKGDIEYLILGQHLEFKNGKLTWFNYGSNLENIHHQVDLEILGIKSGLFKYVCHPDMMVETWNEDIENEFKRLLEVCEQYDMPIEINLYGLRKHNQVTPGDFLHVKWRDDDGPRYPYPKFWELASHYNVRVIIGGDFHNPTHFYANDYPLAKKIVDDYHLNLIEKIDL